MSMLHEHELGTHPLKTMRTVSTIAPHSAQLTVDNVDEDSLSHTTVIR